MDARGEGGRIMTEQEYIDVRDMQRVNSAMNGLRDIVPDNSSVIVQNELFSVMRMLSKWMSDYYRVVHSEPTE